MSSHAPNATAPAVAASLLSNGRYTVMVDRNGSGFSRWRDLAVTRWREDVTGNAWGNYVLLRDVDSGAVWSATSQPCGPSSSADAFTAAAGVARSSRRDGDFETRMSVCVAADGDAELRRVTIVNHGSGARTLELTSYAELVLGSAAGDAGHPAFSKLFVQTEWVEDGQVLLATRRRRGPDDALIWAAHLCSVDAQGDAEYETDRLRFLGRGNTLAAAAAMREGAKLSNTVGCVLDPVFSQRRRVTLAPGAEASVVFWTLAADSRDAALALAASLRADGVGDETMTQAAAHASDQLKHFGIDATAAARCARLLPSLLVSDANMRASAGEISCGRGGVGILGGIGLSGDRPVLLLNVADANALGGVDDILRAQRYWLAQRIGIDVVVLNSADASVQSRLQAIVDEQKRHLAAQSTQGTAGVFAVQASALDANVRAGLIASARVVLDASDLDRVPTAVANTMPTLPPIASPRSLASPRVDRDAPTTREFDNGIGGFVDDGRAYAITLAPGEATPAPWINVVANPDFGFIVSADGGGYCWSQNSQQNPLTPWPNDPVSDTPREALYLRDEDSGALWSATPLPIRVAASTYRIVHGKGWTRFHHVAHEIEVDLVQFVPVADCIKLSRLRLHNTSPRPRRLAITAYAQWALGANGSLPGPTVVTAIDAASGALFASNAWRAENAGRVAFIDLGGHQQSCSGDRTEVLGADGNVTRPLALLGAAPLSNRVGAGLDACGALQTHVEIAAGGTIELVCSIGDAASSVAASALVERWRGEDLDAALAAATAVWDDVLDAIQVRTPDRAMDIVLNHWLPYQALGCRVWARTAYYQASGAYGFRDQLQDVSSLCFTRPDLVREHLLRAAARQFVEGDVQHWWQPPLGQGIRTRMTDDRIWLAYVAVHYIDSTGDAAVLESSVPFIRGAAVPEGHPEAFFTPVVDASSGSLYEHCARGLDVSLDLGAHGLPLMGAGDWNDGMNRVGEKGFGESVWLAWFLVATIDVFAPYADSRGDAARAARWRDCAAKVRTALDAGGWDGAWYRRGYYDDGTPLGSASSSECRIDAIAQSWSVIAGGGDPQHAAQAMAEVERRLILRDEKIALLFTPPFDKTDHDPGYIKGYPPGIRENGGQYTHGTIWSIFAFAKLGQGDHAGHLFSILNPIHHTDSPAAIERYKVEPYIACADVYSVAPHVGRGGWTWYTGSGGWLYRAGLEAILGFHIAGGTHLVLDPCIPAAWPGFAIAYRHRGASGSLTLHDIVVENPRGVSRGISLVEVDGVAVDVGLGVLLGDDGVGRRVRVVMG